MVKDNDLAAATRYAKRLKKSLRDTVERIYQEQYWNEVVFTKKTHFILDKAEELLNELQ